MEEYDGPLSLRETMAKETESLFSFKQRLAIFVGTIAFFAVVFTSLFVPIVGVIFVWTIAVIAAFIVAGVIGVLVHGSWHWVRTGNWDEW